MSQHRPGEQPTPRAREVVRVVVVDHNALARRGLCEVLGEAGGLTVVGQATTAAEAIQLIFTVKPDMVLLDVTLPDGSGAKVCRTVQARLPWIRVLMMTSLDDQEVLQASLQAGAAGVALKGIRAPALIAAVRAVAAGRSLHQQTDSSGFLGREAGVSPARKTLATLSPQEHRVLGAVIDGLTNRQIGQRLGLPEPTVKNHVTSLLSKLGARHRTHAAVIGVSAVSTSSPPRHRPHELPPGPPE
jgi:two-component system response regulator DevR